MPLSVVISAHSSWLCSDHCKSSRSTLSSSLFLHSNKTQVTVLVTGFFCAGPSVRILNREEREAFMYLQQIPKPFSMFHIDCECQ